MKPTEVTLTNCSNFLHRRLSLKNCEFFCLRRNWTATRKTVCKDLIAFIRFDQLPRSVSPLRNIAKTTIDHTLHVHFKFSCKSISSWVSFFCHTAVYFCLHVFKFFHPTFYCCQSTAASQTSVTLAVLFPRCNRRVVIFLRRKSILRFRCKKKWHSLQCLWELPRWCSVGQKTAMIWLQSRWLRAKRCFKNVLYKTAAFRIYRSDIHSAFMFFPTVFLSFMPNSQMLSDTKFPVTWFSSVEPRIPTIQCIISLFLYSAHSASLFILLATKV